MEIENDNLTPGGEAPVEGTQPQVEQPVTQPAQVPTEYEIDGQKYSADQIREAFKAHHDYQALVPEFTRKSQAFAKALQAGLIDEQGNPVQKPAPEQPSADDLTQNPQAKEAVRILKELGFITKEEADAWKKELESFKSTYQTQLDEKTLTEVNATLSAKYDGKKGEPKFDLDQIRQAITANPELIVYDAQGNVNLDLTYKNVHADFWQQIPDMRQKVVRTERGGGPQSTSPATRKKAETEEEKIADAVEFFKGEKAE